MKKNSLAIFCIENCQYREHCGNQTLCSLQQFHCLLVWFTLHTLATTSTNNIFYTHSLSFVLTAIFQVDMDFIVAKGDRGGGNNWSYKTCKAPVKMSPATNQHAVFYRPDALPVAQPTVSKHWREHSIHTVYRNPTQTQQTTKSQ